MDFIPPAIFKVCMLGSVGVGKSSIVERWYNKRFQENANPTIGASYFNRFMYVDGREVQFQVWDTAGQERFRAMLPLYYRCTSAVFVVYDITSRDSFQNVSSYIQDLHNYNDKVDAILILANKSDRIDHREVNIETSQELALKFGALHFETSAYSGEGIEEAFREAARKLLQVNDARLQTRQQNAQNAQKISFDDHTSSAKSKRCTCVI